MMRVLTEQESFDLLCMRFNDLKPLDLLELTCEGRRMCALVTSVEHEARKFTVIEFTDDLIRQLAYSPRSRGDVTISAITIKETTVKIPGNHKDEHPMWNVIPRDKKRFFTKKKAMQAESTWKFHVTKKNKKRR